MATATPTAPSPSSAALLQPMELPMHNELQQPRRIRQSRSAIESERAPPILSALPVGAPRRTGSSAWGAAITITRTSSGFRAPASSPAVRLGGQPSLRKDPLAIVSQQRKFREKQDKMESMRDPSFKEILSKYWSAMTDNGALQVHKAILLVIL